MFQLILVSAIHVLTPVNHGLMTATNVGVLMVTSWKMETIKTVTTLMNVKMRVINVINYVQILKALTIVRVHQGTEKSIALNVRTWMSGVTAFMAVNRFVRTPTALSFVLATIHTDLNITVSNVWISMSVCQTMITRVMSHTWFVLMTLVDITVSAPLALLIMVTDVRM